MAMTQITRDLIEAWTPIPDGEEEAVETMVATYGSAKVAALQLLMKRRGAMAAIAADRSASGDRVNHQANFKPLDALVSELVASIGDSDNVTTAGQVIVDSASGERLSQTRFVPVTAGGERRRAG